MRRCVFQADPSQHRDIDLTHPVGLVGVYKSYLPVFFLWISCHSLTPRFHGISIGSNADFSLSKDGASAPKASAPEKKGGAYYTDSHGAAGAAVAMLFLAEVDKKYMGCRKQALTWLVHEAKKDDQGRISWYQIEGPSRGKPKARILLDPMAYTANTFLNAHAQT